MEQPAEMERTQAGRARHFIAGQLGGEVCLHQRHRMLDATMLRLRVAGIGKPWIGLQDHSDHQGRRQVFKVRPAAWAALFGFFHQQLAKQIYPAVDHEARRRHGAKAARRDSG